MLGLLLHRSPGKLYWWLPVFTEPGSTFVLSPWKRHISEFLGSIHALSTHARHIQAVESDHLTKVILLVDPRLALWL
jgi:hypothetical protein